MEAMFDHSSGFSIEGNNTFNHVPGNQVNGTINARVVNLNAGQAVAKRTEYDQFREVIRGDMIKVKELGSAKLYEWEGERQNGESVGRYKLSQKRIYTVEIVDRQSKFTAMVYEGKDAQDFWEKDFRQFSRTDNPQLFGINQSAIPALIFHYELIPCAHFYTGSFWMDVYISYLAVTLECSEENVWMNTTSGMLFRGPQGPFADLRDSDVDESIVVPYTVDMLKDDTSFTFFSKVGSSVDASVLYCAMSSRKFTLVDDLFPWMAEDPQFKDADHLDSHWYLRDLWQNPPDQLPMDVIGGLRFDTVYSPSLEAVARRPSGAPSLWKFWETDGLMDKTELDGGLIRFTLNPVRRKCVYLRVGYTLTFEREWLSQCFRVFDALGVTKGMDDFFVVGPPSLYLQSNEYFGTSPTLHNAEHLGEETPPSPIYLFLHPFPMTISELVSWHKGKPYFWSFDESGKSQMSEEECERWGLPVIEPDFPLILISWPIHVYSVLRDWQKARGFDPTTSDWARSMGRPELEIIGTEDCFVLVEETSDEDSEWEVLSDA